MEKKMKNNSVFELSGEWNLSLSKYSTGMSFAEKVTLPATLDENKIGEYNAQDDISKLSRYYIYTGAVTYQKSVYVDGEWADKNITLFMERTRETRVWINGEEVKAPDTSNVLVVPQRYDISSKLKFGEYNDIAIVVDNSFPSMPAEPIIRGHMATEETQTNWNGILGEFKLEARDKVFIDDLRIYPNGNLKSVKVEIDIKNTTSSAYAGAVTLSCADTSQSEEVYLAAGESKTFTVADYAMPADVKLWSEFETTLYEMKAMLDNRDFVEEKFGMRCFKNDVATNSIKINGKKVFIRSEANCAVFPLTGHAPMKAKEWENLFSTYKSYGINMVRFHSWCPPKVAFEVADRLGLYLQPELSCWDGAMFDSDIKKTYYSKEAFAIIKEYANHPSFVMFTYGNELRYQEENYQYADQLIQDLKAKDSTRLYAAGSNTDFGGLAPTPKSDFQTSERFLADEFRGAFGSLNGFINQKYPSAAVNYDHVVERVAKYNVPSFNFEVGQFQIFPDVLTEPQKYNGVLEPRNFKMISNKIKAKGIFDDEIEKSIKASGMLSRLSYKAEIEAVLRTKDMSGISLLGIQDFSGQGTALVGMMNALGEPKPYDFADPREFSKFFAPIVVLFEMPKFCYKNTEKLEGNLLLANFSDSDFEGEIRYKLSDGDEVLFQGKTEKIAFKQGERTKAEKISVSLDEIEKPTQLKLKISCLEHENSYNIWVYPEINQPVEDVYVARYLDDKATKILADGGKVLLSPIASKGMLPQSIEGRFTTAFWSVIDVTQPGTLGLLLDPKHPVFEDFPTDYHSDYQWWAMTRLGRPMKLDGLTDGFRLKPLVKAIDGFEHLDNLGLLYEAKVGNGKLMVSSMGLEETKDSYPEAMALRGSIIKYMNSDAFNPSASIDIDKINQNVVNGTPASAEEERMHRSRSIDNTVYID